MEQIQQYVDGERDYTVIKGGTGPLVYPAAHVYIYRILYHVTDKGHDIITAQRLFGVLYLATIAVVMACYRRAKVNPFRKAISTQGDQRTDYALNFIGSNLYPSYAYPFETTSQHIRPPSVQRLLRGILLMGCYLRLSTQVMDVRKPVIQLGFGNKDVCPSGSSSSWCHVVSEQRCSSWYQASLAHWTGADNSRISFLTYQRNRLSPASVRIFATVSVQMDGQLEICGRRNILK